MTEVFDMRWLKPIILYYLIELNNSAPVSDDELEFRAEKLVNDIKRTMGARADFKPRKENEA